MLVYGQFQSDASARIEGPGGRWNFSQASPIPLGSWTWPPASELGGYGFTVRYAIDDDEQSEMIGPILFSAFAQLSLAGYYFRFQFVPSDGMDFTGIEAFWFVVQCELAAAPAAPVLVSATRDGNSGSLFAIAEPGATVHAWGNALIAGSGTVIEIGSAVANEDGAAALALDFSLLNMSWGSWSVSTPAQVTINASNAVGCSPPAPTIAFGLFGDLVESVAVTSVQRSADRLSAAVTLSGLQNNNKVWIGWLGSSGVGLREFTGNGPHTIYGLNRLDTFSPFVIGISAAIQGIALVGYCELARLPAPPAPAPVPGNLTYAQIEDAVLAALADMTEEFGLRALRSYGGELSTPKDLVANLSGQTPAILVHLPDLRNTPDGNLNDSQELTIAVNVIDQSSRDESDARRGDATVTRPGVYALVEGVRARLNRLTLTATVEGKVINDGCLRLNREWLLLQSKELQNFSVMVGEFTLRRKVKVPA